MKDKAINKIVDNEIWEPIIILYRSEKKVIKATSRKRYLHLFYVFMADRLQTTSRNPWC